MNEVAVAAFGAAALAAVALTTSVLALLRQGRDAEECGYRTRRHRGQLRELREQVARLRGEPAPVCRQEDDE